MEEDLYEAVGQYRTSAVFSERERVALEFADRFCTDHESISDELMERVNAQFTPPETVELAVCVARHLGFGRITRVFHLDHDACPLPFGNVGS